ncbi:MAG: purine-nucleoside/S-methyl-5-thioadenosine phosphorylase / adenosine deaminase, partial [Actinomycetota bacterium]|nr:purine-nucleoside/S-methyl-5-thioadenosine phosphorylase / adenosine deaminase [Actinomycetota bacterium]
DRRDWAMVRQVHGAGVVVADHVGHLGDADAIVTATPQVPIAVRVADCAPVALVADGAIGVVHAGWRGIVAGVLPAALDAMQSLGATDIRAVLGPCIHAECYEFGGDELDAVAASLGDVVRGTTSWGTPALDVPAAIRAQVPWVEDESVCTACSSEHWSHRARGDQERQALVAWLEA